MKIQLLLIGNTSTPYLKEGIENYVKRIGHYVPFEVRTLPDVKAGKGMTEERQKEKEGAMILGSLQPGDLLVLLDERGKQMTSRGFAEWIDRKSVTVGKRLVFSIGGPYGFAQEVYDRADELLSLSKMTFSHEMVRLFFVEQIYRAMTILRGEPYHHD